MAEIKKLALSVWKPVEKWLNILFYNFYLLEYKISEWVDTVLRWALGNLKRGGENKYSSPSGFGRQTRTGKLLSYEVTNAGITITALCAIVIWGLSLTIAGWLDAGFFVTIFHTVCYFALSFLTCHYSIFRKRKYLNYFEQFEKWTRTEQRIYGAISATVTAASIAVFLYSFQFT